MQVKLAFNQQLILFCVKHTVRNLADSMLELKSLVIVILILL